MKALKDKNLVNHDFRFDSELEPRSADDDVPPAIEPPAKCKQGSRER